MASTKSLEDYIVAIFVVAILCSAFLSSTMSNFNTMIADTTNFSAQQILILTGIASFLLLGILLKVIKASKN